MKNLNVKQITTEEEARRYFETQEDTDDIMQYLDMDEVVKDIEEAEQDIEAGRVVGCEKFLEMIAKRMSWERGEHEMLSKENFEFREVFGGKI